MKLIVIIPALNEQETIVGVINKIPPVIAGVDQIETVVIDDGSKDETAERVLKETAVKVISHEKNMGVGFAFQSGINFALKNRADLAVMIDADGQFDPADIPALIRPIIENQADFTTASRFIQTEFIPNMPKVKLWGNKKIANLISQLVGKKFYDVSCGFRAYGKEALLNLNLFGHFTYTQEVFLDLSFKNLRIKEIPLNVKYFSGRKSRVCRSIFGYALNTLKIIFRTLRDYRPLRFFGSIGLLIFSLGFILDLFVFVYYLFTGGFSPYKAFGFAGAGFNFFGAGIIFMALIADMLYRVRINQEKLLYYEKKRNYYDS